MIDCQLLPNIFVTRHQILAVIAIPETTLVNLLSYLG
jgi:hypothetical protein